MLVRIMNAAREYRRTVPDGCQRENVQSEKIMPNPSDIASFIQTFAAALVADILESCSPDEIQQLVEELELRLSRSRLH